MNSQTVFPTHLSHPVETGKEREELGRREGKKQSLAHQWMLQHYHVLPLPFGLKHLCKVGTASAEDAAVGAEGFAMNNENDVALVTLLQQPVRNREGKCTAE